MSSQVYSSETRLLSLFLPHKRLCKVDKLYQYIYVYHDLSKYKFNQEEKDFLCECIYRGNHSIIGKSFQNIILSFNKFNLNSHF